MSDNLIVQVDNVTKQYGGKNEKKYEALKGVSFGVAKGEFIAIMGASGSGKTTLLNILSTLDQPTTGSVKINQQEIGQLKGNKLSDFRGKEIGFIFQDFNLIESLTAKENIALPLSLQNVKYKTISSKIDTLAMKLGIFDLLDKYPTELSGGQKQRVAACRALIHNPSIVYGDEPTGALDSKSAKELLETFSTLNEEDGVSILMVTHDAFSASYCDRLLFIKDGKIDQELKREAKGQEAFYHEILELLATVNN